MLTRLIVIFIQQEVRLSENNYLNENKWAGWAFVALLCVVGLIAIAGSYFQKIDVVEFVAAASTFTIALLTVAYVRVTSGQLAVMKRQLDEMGKARELGSQPFPAVEIQRIVLEKPNFFYTPPEKEYSTNPRSYVEYKVINHGSVPAVGTVSAASIMFGDDEGELIQGGASFVSILGPSETIPEEGNKIFLFTGKEHNRLMSHLVDKKYRNPPALFIRTICRNILGGCFASTWMYEFSPKNEEDFEVLTNWRSKVASFEIDFGNELERLRSLKGKNDGQWHELFGKVRERFEQSLTGPSELELAYAELPNTFSAEVVSLENYEKEVSIRNFGRPIPRWMTSCLSENDDD